MANIQVSRLASRQDQVLQVPFPTPPSLMSQIDQGVLKQRGAGNYDQQLRKWVESVQNVLRLSLRFPQLEQWQEQLDSLLTMQSSVTSILATLVTLQAAVTSLSATTSSNSSAISDLQTEVANLTVAINLFNQFVYTQSTPLNPWPVVYSRSIRPGGIRVMTLTFGEVYNFSTDDSVLGTTSIGFGASATGLAILTFS